MYTPTFGGLLEVILPCYVKYHENNPCFMDTSLQNELRQKMRELRDLGGYSQKDMADAMEISPRSFSAIPQPKLEDISAKNLLERVVQLAVSESKDLNIRIESFVQPENLRLQADPGQLEMVLLNLIKNAREAFTGTLLEDAGTLTTYHSPLNTKRITLRVGADAKGRPFIEVEDNGPGIPAELLEEIFIPFFTTKPTGTGVGLSISKQILQLHGGDVRVSTSTGGGARFVLEF